METVLLVLSDCDSDFIRMLNFLIFLGLLHKVKVRIRIFVLLCVLSLADLDILPLLFCYMCECLSCIPAPESLDIR